MKKVILILAFVIGTAAFSNCNVKAKKLLDAVIEKKLTVSKNDKLKYFEPEMDGNKYYKYKVFEDHGDYVVYRTYVELNMETGTVFELNTANDRLEEIYQDKKNICK